MSSDDQKTSIGQQRTEVHALATKIDCQLIREYQELGKSGSRNQVERTEFQRMLQDSLAKDFDVVLCYDCSRFARLDSIDGAVAKQTLRANGVYLVTVKEGRIDWNSFEGRLLDVILSESNHKFSRDLSRESLRGRQDRLRHKFWPHGAVPYGFDREYSLGDEKRVVARSAKFGKP